MYAKLINSTLRRAPNTVSYNGYTVFNPPENILLEMGYFPVTYTNPPADAPEGQHYESHWEQGETEILQVWSLIDGPEIPEPELTAEEALNIIFGGETDG